MKKEHVQGKKKGEVMLFALSTCVWCKKTKQLLMDLGVDYRYVFVDLADKADLDQIEKELEKWNPSGSLPTLVIDNKECIVGYNPDAIKKRLGR
jgi:glutaredoxin-like protein NrdH